MYQYIHLFGLSISTYSLFDNLSYVAQVIVTFFIAHQFRDASTIPALVNLRFNKKGKDSFFWRWGVVIILMLLFAVIIYLFNILTGTPISMIITNTKDDTFFPNIFVGPITIFLFSLITLNSPLKTMDVITPVAEVALIFYKLSCFFWGCCNGIEWEKGLYNYRNERYEVPIQLVEIACAIIMFIIIMKLVKKERPHQGTLYPLFMMMYCGSRFVSEFWRGDYPTVFWRLTGNHFACIAGFLEGALFMAVFALYGDRITAFFEEKNNAVLVKYQRKYKKTYRLLQKRSKNDVDSIN